MGHLTDSHRFEIKYLVACRDIPEVLRQLQQYLVADRHGTGDCGSSIYSVYWDSPDLTFFWAKVEGLEYRRKLRLRRYVGSGDVQVEIKQGTDRTLHERRHRMPVSEAVRAFSSLARGWGSLPDDIDDPAVTAAAVLCHRYQLAPRVGIRYRRVAFSERCRKSICLRFRRAEPAHREPAREHSQSASNRSDVHAGFLLPGRKPRSKPVQRGTCC